MPQKIVLKCFTATLEKVTRPNFSSVHISLTLKRIRIFSVDICVFKFPMFRPDYRSLDVCPGFIRLRLLW